MKNIEQIWQEIMNGKIVYWENEGYRITMTEALNNEYQLKHFSHKNGFVLCITCTENWFGSLIDESEVKKCFVTENY
jgi:hypothetical protein